MQVVYFIKIVLHFITEIVRQTQGPTGITCGECSTRLLSDIAVEIEIMSNY